MVLLSQKQPTVVLKLDISSWLFDSLTLSRARWVCAKRALLTTFCLLAVTFLWCKIANRNSYILKEWFAHFPTRPSLSNLENELLTKLVLKVRSSDANTFVDDVTASATCSKKNSLKKQSSLSGLQCHGIWALNSLSGIDYHRSDSPKFTTSQVSGSASLLPTLVGTPSTACPRPRLLPRSCAPSLPPPTPLPTNLLAQWTHPPRSRCCPRLQTTAIF